MLLKSGKAFAGSNFPALFRIPLLTSVVLLLFSSFFPCASQVPPTDLQNRGSSGMYDDCITTSIRGCVGFGSGDCLDARSCVSMITYIIAAPAPGQTKRIYFQMASKTPGISGGSKYVALGFSHNNQMGNDVVISCITMGSSQTIKLSQNTAGYANDHNVGATQDQQLQLQEVLYVNNEILCAFNIPLSISAKDSTFNLGGTPSFLLSAFSQAVTGEEIAPHSSSGRFSTTSTVNLNFIGRTVGTDDPEIAMSIRVHIILMVLAFQVLMPTCMLIARFLKESHINFRLFHRRLWFLLHTFGLSVALIKVFVAEILIFVYIGFFSKWDLLGYKLHYLIGTIATTLYSMQAILGIVAYIFVMPGCGILKRIAPFLHFIWGVLTLFLGVLQIFLAPLFLPAYLFYCSAGSLLVILWVIFYFCTYILLTFIMWRSDKHEVDTMDPSQIPKYGATKLPDSDSDSFDYNSLPPSDAELSKEPPKTASVPKTVGASTEGPDKDKTTHHANAKPKEEGDDQVIITASLESSSDFSNVKLGRILGVRNKPRHPNKALTAYPMMSYFIGEFPKTVTADIIITVFFLGSLVFSVAIISYVVPHEKAGACSQACVAGVPCEQFSIGWLKF